MATRIDSNAFLDDISRLNELVDDFSSTDCANPDLVSILQAMVDAIQKLDLQTSQKVDRLEFSSIIQNKANAVDLQHLARCLNEVLKAHKPLKFQGFEENQLLAHLLGDDFSFLDRSAISND